jgi:hypothetical protein
MTFKAIYTAVRTEGFWSHGGGPAWLQAISASFAVGLAFYAYWAWSHELAKRRADLSADIMRSALEATTCLHNARLGFVMDDTNGVDFDAAEVKRLVNEVAGAH